jgi:hypothetical protein
MKKLLIILLIFISCQEITVSDNYVGWLVCAKTEPLDNFKSTELIQLKKGKEITWVEMYKFESLNFKVGDTIKILPIKTDIK